VAPPGLREEGHSLINDPIIEAGLEAACASSSALDAAGRVAGGDSDAMRTGSMSTAEFADVAQAIAAAALTDELSWTAI